MGLLFSGCSSPILARLGSRTILGIGGRLFLLNMIIPDPLPLVDEFLILAGTILLSRMGRTGCEGAAGATGARGAQVRRVRQVRERRSGCGEVRRRCTQARRPQFDLASISNPAAPAPHRTLLRGLVSKLFSHAQTICVRRGVDMPGTMFQELVSPHAQHIASGTHFLSRFWCTPRSSQCWLSCHSSQPMCCRCRAAHSSTSTATSRRLCRHRRRPSAATSPPPPSIATQQPGVPLVAPDTIGDPSGVILQPRTHRDPGSRRNTIGGFGVGAECRRGDRRRRR